MDSILVQFKFQRAGGLETLAERFDADDECLQDVIEERQEELLREGRVSDGFDVVEFDNEFADPADFGDLNEYGAYAVNVEKFGEAYHLRYEDVGENEFEDEYHGCWGSFEEYAKNYVDDYMEIPESMLGYFDYEKFAKDLSMDYSEYEGNEGVHVFSS